MEVFLKMLMLLVVDVIFNFKMVLKVFRFLNQGIISPRLVDWWNFLAYIVKLGIIFCLLSKSGIDGYQFWLTNFAYSDIFILFIIDAFIIIFFNPGKEKV